MAASFFSNLFTSTTTPPATSVTITMAQMLAFLATLEKMGMINKSLLTPANVIEIGNLLSLQGVTVPQELIASIVAAP
jgi:hypothetical protein